MNGARIEFVQLPDAIWQDPIANPADCQAIYDRLVDNPRESLGVVFEWV
ncbi:MAG: hypothetical protein OXH16_12525 [Gemmatimonadetes bacterium]|nr:hypothetical protein [Gemmatimonadota bacterium]